MPKRGYPMADFAHRAADISVHHPAVVEPHRAAQAILLRDQRDEAATEDLRKGVVHCRALFEERLDTHARQPVVPPPAKVHAGRISQGQPSSGPPVSLLFTADAAEAFRAGRDAMPIGFADDPGHAVQKAVGPVAQVMKGLAQRFCSERAKINAQFSEGGTANTGSQRVALRCKRSIL